MVLAEKNGEQKEFTCVAWDCLPANKAGWTLVSENCPDTDLKDSFDSPQLPQKVAIMSLPDCDGNPSAPCGCPANEPVDPPEPTDPVKTYTNTGLLWRLKQDAQQLTCVDYWGGADYPGGGNAVAHDDVSNIFINLGNTLQHPNQPNASFKLPNGDIKTNDAAFVAGAGAANIGELAGQDQIKVKGFIIINQPSIIRDENLQTGERGGIYINKCCAGELVKLYEDTTDSGINDRWILDNLPLPIGIHYFEVVTSDVSQWQGFNPTVSTDEGVTFETLPIYDIKPQYECIAVLRCNDSGDLINADTGDPITIGVNDMRCEPPSCTPEAEPEVEPEPLKFETIKVDCTLAIQSKLLDEDIHNNGNVVKFASNTTVDAGWNRVGNTFSYNGSPNIVRAIFAINADDTGASNYWARPKISVTKNGQIIAVLDDLAMQATNNYDGDATINGLFSDNLPGANPSYTVEWFREDNRTATLTPNPHSCITFEAIEKVEVLKKLIEPGEEKCELISSNTYPYVNNGGISSQFDQVTQTYNIKIAMSAAAIADVQSCLASGGEVQIITPLGALYITPDATIVTGGSTLSATGVTASSCGLEMDIVSGASSGDRTINCFKLI